MPIAWRAARCMGSILATAARCQCLSYVLRLATMFDMILKQSEAIIFHHQVQSEASIGQSEAIRGNQRPSLEAIRRH